MLQVSDFAGRFRLPQNPVLQVEYNTALGQINRRLLRNFFEEDTVSLIMADATQPPATQLRSLSPPIQEACLAWAAENMQLTVTGVGVKQSTSETHKTPVIMWPESLAGLSLFFDVLKRQEPFWAGSVISLSGSTVTLPPQAVAWLRPGMLLDLDGQEYTIGAIAGSTVTLTTTPASAQRYRIKELKLKSRSKITEINGAFLP